MKARELRLMAVALGGLALVLAARGGEPRSASVTVENSATAEPPTANVVTGGGSGGDSLPGLTEQIREVVGTQSVRLLDFDEVDQTGDTCADGVEGAVPRIIQVTEGESGVLDPDLTTRLEVDGSVVYGDIDNDGRDEAVVHTICEYGANGAQDSIKIWDLDTGRAQAKASLGEPPAEVTGPLPPAVKQIEIDRGDVVVTWTHYAQDDPNCCPSKLTRIRYRLVGTQLMVIGAPVTTTVG